MSQRLDLGPLLEALADELAPRVAAALNGHSPTPDESESWHLLDLKETAARLGRSERWVRERVKRGELVHVRLDGGALAFEVDDLREFAQARRVGGR